MHTSTITGGGVSSSTSQPLKRFSTSLHSPLPKPSSTLARPDSTGPVTEVETESKIAMGFSKTFAKYIGLLNAHKLVSYAGEHCSAAFVLSLRLSFWRAEWRATEIRNNLEKPAYPPTVLKKAPPTHTTSCAGTKAPPTHTTNCAAKHPHTSIHCAGTKALVHITRL